MQNTSHLKQVLQKNNARFTLWQIQMVNLRISYILILTVVSW